MRHYSEKKNHEKNDVPHVALMMEKKQRREKGHDMHLENGKELNRGWVLRKPASLPVLENVGIMTDQEMTTVTEITGEGKVKGTTVPLSTGPQNFVELHI